VLLATGFSAWAVLLDTGASANLFCNDALLTNIRIAKTPICVNGIAGNVRVTLVGDFGDFGEVYYCPDVNVNILGFSVLAKTMRIDYNYAQNGGTFTVHTALRAVRFVCERGLYVHDSHPNHVLTATVQERESRYTKRQVEAARAARELARAMGYPSNASMIKLLQSGAIINVPTTVSDLQRAEAIYGPDIAALKGKTKRRKPNTAKFEHIPVPPQSEQTLSADIMFVNGEPFLVVVADPLGLVLARWLKARTAGVLAEALTAMVNELTARGFKPTALQSDGEGGLAAISSTINALGMVFNPAGPEQHVPIVENKIRQIKERVRAILSTLFYKLASFLLKWLVLYCVNRLNMCPSSTRVDSTSPRELFLQRKVDYKRDLRISFGDYVQTHCVNTIRNSMAPRVEGAIALLPTGNLQGSVKFYCLSTGTVITRDHWTVVPLSDNVIHHMNEIANTHKRGNGGFDPAFARGPSPISDSVVAADEEPVPFEESPRVDPSEPSNADDFVTPSAGHDTSSLPVTFPDVPSVPSPAPPSIVSLPAPVPVVTPAAAADPPLEVQDSNPSEPVPSPVEPDPEPEVFQPPPDPVEEERRYPRRKNRTSWNDKRADSLYTGVHSVLSKYNDSDHELFVAAVARLVEQNKSDMYGLHITVKKAIAEYGDEAHNAIKAELQQMLDLHVWTPVAPASLTPEEMRDVIFSSMFLKDKHHPNGDFDKLKARLVANGAQQDRSLYKTSHVSSPTVSNTSVFVCAGIAAMERRHVVTMDIIGAYLKIDMTGRKVRVRLSAEVAANLCELRPSYKPFLLRDGSLIVALDKAMYGCLESAKLLYNHVREALLSDGFVQNEYDLCVFNKGTGANQCTVLLYVDDIMITCADISTVDHVVEHLTGVYQTVKVTRGKKHSYLGMSLDFSKDGDCKITMDGYIAEVLRYADVTGTASSPASLNLFNLSETSPQLPEKDRQHFHTVVAKLLYLAKRVRSDLLPAVSFLSTRVTGATVEDSSKLRRALQYLNGSRNVGLVLSFDPKMVLVSYVDVSYGVHADCKSHTGGLLSLGGGSFAAKSTKQKLVAKSSTEGELIGVSDYSGEILETRNFLISQGYDMGEATLFQDNLSTIAMIKNGRPTSDRSRHVNIRFFYIKDRVDSGEISVKYKPTADMIADILTKPLQGALFKRLRAALLNWVEE